MAEDEVRGGHCAVDAELLEQPFVLGVVDARHGTRHVVTRLRDLTEGQVVLVVAGRRHGEVGALHAGLLHCRRVAGVTLHDDVGTKFGGHEVDALRVQLDDEDLVVGDQRARKVIAHLSGAADDDEHLIASPLDRFAKQVCL